MLKHNAYALILNKFLSLVVDNTAATDIPASMEENFCDISKKGMIACSNCLSTFIMYYR